MPYDNAGNYKVGTLSFDPTTVLIKMKSTVPNYLEVKWRLVMLREMFPEAQLRTEIVEANPDGGEGNKGYVVYKATIQLPAMRINPETGVVIVPGAVGTGHKREDKAHFSDPYEKAETGSIGRALYAVGVGAQFSHVDFEYESESPKDFAGVDSPVVAPAAPRPRTKTVVIPTQEVMTRLAAVVPKIGGPTILQDRAEVLFGVRDSSKLNEKQLVDLLSWAESQAGV